MLERQQREEEATMLQQEEHLAPGQGRSNQNPAVSAPTTPPFSVAASGERNALYDSKHASNGSAPNAAGELGSGLSGLNDTEDGLNGSNVPGLAPLSSARSQPGTRRTSREMRLSPLASGQDSNLDGPRRSIPGPGDLASSFNRLNVGPPHRNNGGTSPSQQQQQQQHPLPAAGFQRLLSKTGVDGTGSAPASTPSGEAAAQGNNAMTPVFNERFLFDDELDAEDSAFVRKYGLSGDDDNFPVLLRNDKFQEMPSSRQTPSSAALDLAQTDNRGRSAQQQQQQSSQLSEWSSFDARGNPTSIGPERRGPSERNSPRISGGGPGAGNHIGLGRPSPLAASASGSASDLASMGLSRQGSIGRGTSPRAFSGGSQAPNPSTSPVSRFASGANEGQRRAFGPGSGHGPSYKDDAPAPRPTSGFFQAFGNGTGVDSAFGAFNSAADSHKGLGGPMVGSNAMAGNAGELDVNTRLEDLKGEIFTLCKDQHGCRFLQKKLEDGVGSHRDMIFAETFQHFAELMTDPFGNYLCQKMLEYCTDEQRNLIVESVSSKLVTISLNMHGTRAVQKTIDFLSTSRQIHSIILSLSMNVVTLIKDLNGNHVIQKCLNRLNAEDNQFIYDAVAARCVEVATHRHGCCVLQRCVDHASDKQRVQLVQEITYNALTLVQDPFGNYVVQYILDLNDARFTEAIIRQFIGNVCLLSVQKFSSNVIEKCIRVADANLRRQLTDELLNRARLEKLLRDSFANYVVQTALDYSEPMQRAQLVECIRPILPMIRNTPYGKRIQSKLQRETFDGSGGPGAGPNGGGPGGVNMGNVPFHILQAAAHQQQQQFQAAMAMAARHPMEYGGGNMNGMNPYMGSPGPYGLQPQVPPSGGGGGGGTSASGGPHYRQQPPHMNQQQQHHHHHPPHHQGGGGGSGNERGAGRHGRPSHVSALPPPHQLYGAAAGANNGDAVRSGRGGGPAVAGGSASMGRFPSSGSGSGSGSGYGGASAGAGGFSGNGGFSGHLNPMGYGQGGHF